MAAACWFAGQQVHSVDGIYQIEQAELNKFWNHPLQKLKWESFAVTDGVRGVASQVGPLPTLAVAPDGRIFYATANQVGWIDPLAIRHNRRAPDVLILNLRYGDVELKPKGDISLPAGTTALDIPSATGALSACASDWPGSAACWSSSAMSTAAPRWALCSI